MPFLKQKFGEYLAVQPFNIKKNRERKLFCKWVKDFIQPVMEDKDSSPIPRLRWCVCRTKMSTELTESKVERCSVFSYSVLRSCYFVATDSTREVLAFNGLETLNIQTNGNSIKAYS